MLNESRIYTFIDQKHGFSLSFLEGQKLMADLVTIHNLNTHALNYYRQTVLTSVQMINFLKAGENLGFYIDSEHPYFRFKIELNYTGKVRTLLLPEEFSEFPERVTGVCRVSKVFSHNKAPYTSVSQVNNEISSNVINIVLKESYQTNSEIITSEEVDQTLMITKLPPIDIKKEVIDDISLKEYILQNKMLFQKIFSNQFNSIEPIVELLEGAGFEYLSSKQVEFFCPCSKERMIQNITTLAKADIDEVFAEENAIEVRCDYCNTLYKITKEEFLAN